jgi:hypothetical protein
MARKKRTNKSERTPWFDDLSPQAKQAIAAVFLGILGVFFLFSLLGYAGVVGRWTDTSLRFLFGSGAWLAPFLCLLYIIVFLSPIRETELISRSKVVGAALLFVSALAGLEFYHDSFGGLVGLSLAWPLAKLFGDVVAGVLVGGLILVSIFLLLNTGIRLPAASLRKRS